MKNKLQFLLASVLFFGMTANAVDPICPTFETKDISSFYSMLSAAVFVSGKTTNTADDKRAIKHQGAIFFMPVVQWNYLMQKDKPKMSRVGVKSITLKSSEKIGNRTQCHYEAEMESHYAVGVKIPNFVFRMTHVDK